MESVSTPELSEKAGACLRDGLIQKALAVLVTVGLFSIIGFMLVWPIPDTGHDALLILVGALAAGWTGILGYYFGSSSGSAAKSAMARS